MTCVDRPSFAFYSDTPAPARSLALLTVAALHVLLIGLVVVILDKVPWTPPHPVPDVRFLNETRPLPPPEENLRAGLRPDPGDIRPSQPQIPPIADENPVEGPLQASGPDEAPVAGAGATADVIVPPRLDPNRAASRPRYPAQSARLGETGVVVARLCADADGRVTGVGLTASSGFARLDEAALGQLRNPGLRLLPGTRNGVAAPLCTDVRIRFELEGR